MLRSRSKKLAGAAPPPQSDSPRKPPAKEDVWEVRPGGMLVQRRGAADGEAIAAAGATVPTIRVKVKHAGVYVEIYVSAQASFGELKKLLAARTGVHPEDQKVVFKDKERDSKAFLDVAGVKDKSKMVLVEDPTAKARRLIELRRQDKMERDAKAVARAAADVDELAKKVSALEKGGRVADADIVTVTECLMNELVELDGIAAAADGEVKKQRQALERRIKKCVETLDMVKIKNAALPAPQQVQKREFLPAPPQAAAVVTSASWENFDLLTSSMMAEPFSPASSASSFAAVTAPAPARFEWELF